MKKKMVWKRYAAWMAAGILAASLAGCGNESDPVGQMGTSGQDQLSEESRSGTASGQSQAAGTVESLVYAEELFTERDLSGSFDEKSAVWISRHRIIFCVIRIRWRYRAIISRSERKVSIYCPVHWKTE